MLWLKYKYKIRSNFNYSPMPQTFIAVSSFKSKSNHNNLHKFYFTYLPNNHNIKNCRTVCAFSLFYPFQHSHKMWCTSVDKLQNSGFIKEPYLSTWLVIYLLCSSYSSVTTRTMIGSLLPSNTSFGSSCLLRQQVEFEPGIILHKLVSLTCKASCW